MKINSDTLYRQWSNLTYLCPERCDPNWVDLNRTNISDEKLLEEIERVQQQSIGCAAKGYAWFIEDMASLLKEHPSEILPKVGASSLQLKYQNPTNSLREPEFFDYYIVPKLSRVSGAFMCPGKDFSIIKRAGRFSPKSVSSTKQAFHLEQVKYMMETEGSDYYLLNREYDTELPLPTDPPNQKRGISASAETEWIDLNLLANFRFTKSSVVLMYLPIAGGCSETVLQHVEVRMQRRPYMVNKDKYKRKNGTAAKRQAIKAALNGRYSRPIKITAKIAMSKEVDNAIASILEDFSENISAEAFTDAATDRELLKDGAISKVREELQTDELDEEMYNPLSTFIFSAVHPKMYRDPNPGHVSRVSDSNRGVLFQHGTGVTMLKERYVRVFDAAAEEFIAKSMDEWMVDCMIDDIKLMNRDRVGKLLDRGLSPDNIIYLSSLVEDAAPEAQFEKVVSDFIEEEIKLTLR